MYESQSWNDEFAFIFLNLYVLRERGVLNEKFYCLKILCSVITLINLAKKGRGT